MLLGLLALRQADDSLPESAPTPLTAPQSVIGRGKECDIVLNDPSRRISRKHAVIVRERESYKLKVSSQLNPVILNGEPLSYGQRRTIRPGDLVAIGDYEFGIVEVSEASFQAPTPVRSNGAPSGDPRDDWSPRGLEVISAPNDSAAISGVHRETRSGKTQSKAVEHRLYDGSSHPSPEPVKQQSAQSTAPAASFRTDGSALVEAFLRGVGVPDIQLPDAHVESFLEDCGTTLRAAIEGLMTLLLVRAKVREELQASDRTMVAARENNPLKLCESLNEALQSLLDPAGSTRGFLPPTKAVADACLELQIHELALMSGMRAALLSAIRLFDPAVIQKRLQTEGAKSLLTNRRALLWECFVAYFAQIEADARDDFEGIFGAEFLTAYEQQVRRSSG